MSVATSFRHADARQATDRPRRPRATEVPYLRLVAPIPAPAVDADESRAAPVFTLTQPSLPSFAVRHRPVRLTRRGRAVLWLLLLTASVAVMALLAPASQASAPAGPPRTVTVHSGDTMWSIATRAMPHAAPNVAIERIRVLNHLSDNEVYAGEQLLIPAA